MVSHLLFHRSLHPNTLLISGATWLNVFLKKSRAKNIESFDEQENIRKDESKFIIRNNRKEQKKQEENPVGQEAATSRNEDSKIKKEFYKLGCMKHSMQFHE